MNDTSESESPFIQLKQRTRFPTTVLQVYGAVDTLARSEAVSGRFASSQGWPISLLKLRWNHSWQRKVQRSGKVIAGIAC